MQKNKGELGWRKKGHHIRWKWSKAEKSYFGWTDLERKRIGDADKKHKTVDVLETETAELIPPSCGF